MNRPRLLLILTITLGLTALAAAGWHWWQKPRLVRGEFDAIQVRLQPEESRWEAWSFFPNLRVSQPVFMEQPPRDPASMVILERTGRLLWVPYRANVANAETTVLWDFRQQVRMTENADDGALGFTFHPQFGVVGDKNAGTMFVFYTAKRGDLWFNRLSRIRVDLESKMMIADSEEILIDQEDDADLHNGGSLSFGSDGFLYVSLGDEGIGRHRNHHPQRIHGSLFAGIIRIDVDEQGGQISHPPKRQPDRGQTSGYFIPSDNPFVGQDNVLEEFWALGLRNPHRMSFDHKTGRLWAGDVGSGLREEVDEIVKGGNYQWAYREGSLPFLNSPLKGRKPNPFIGREMPPYYEYSHASGDRCVIGGYVYRGSQLPDLAGRYLYGDNGSGRVYALDLETRETELLVDLKESFKEGISSLGQDLAGELFVIALGDGRKPDGKFYRLRRREAAERVEIPLELSKAGIFRNVDSLEVLPGFYEYHLAQPSWESGLEKRHWLSLPAGSSIRIADPYSAWQVPPASVFVQHLSWQGDPVETRVMTKGQGGQWQFGNFAWQGGDATLVQKSFVRRLGDMEWRHHEAGICAACHQDKNSMVLGLRTLQWNREVPFAGGHRDQLELFAQAGFFEAPENIKWPHYDQGGDEGKLASYLDANCSYCHFPNGIGFGEFDLRYEHWSPSALVGTRVRNHVGIENAGLLVPGHPERSILYERMRSNDPAKLMPPYGKVRGDAAGAEALRRWILAMKEDKQGPAK